MKKLIPLLALMAVSCATTDGSYAALRNAGHTNIQMTKGVDPRCGNKMRYWTSTSPSGGKSEGCAPVK